MIVGYSNGGALAVNYALDTLEDARLPTPTALVLVSPMIGVSPVARLARLISLLGPFPFFEKARWLDVVPEYNPFKYNSFPANAGLQTGRFTAAIQGRLASAAEAGRLARFPPVLAFQSVVDTTVSTPAVVNHLFSRLPANGHELVLFDLNRTSGVEAFTKPGAVLPRLTGEGARPFTVTLVTNRSAETARGVGDDRGLGLDRPGGGAAGPRLAGRHVLALARRAAVSADDPLYGGASTSRDTGGVSLGRVTPRGEKDVLIVPIEVLMRVSWNPFFSYLADRLERWAASRHSPLIYRLLVCAPTPGSACCSRSWPCCRPRVPRPIQRPMAVTAPPPFQLAQQVAVAEVYGAVPAVHWRGLRRRQRAGHRSCRRHPLARRAPDPYRPGGRDEHGRPHRWLVRDRDGRRRDSPRCSGTSTGT